MSERVYVICPIYSLFLCHVEYRPIAGVRQPSVMVQRPIASKIKVNATVNSNTLFYCCITKVKHTSGIPFLSFN